MHRIAGDLDTHEESGAGGALVDGSHQGARWGHARHLLSLLVGEEEV